MSTYKTDTSTWQMRSVQYLLIAVSLLVIAGNGYKYMAGLNYSYLNLFSGFCFLFMGACFPRLFKTNAIIIDSEAIRNINPATRFEAASEERSKWSNIKKVSLGKFSVRVIEKMRMANFSKGLNKKFRLPIYNRNQFQKIKTEIKHLAEENGVTFETRSW